MTLQIPDGFAHIVFSLNLTGDPQPMATTIGIKITEGVTDTQAVVDHMATAFKDNVLDIVPSSYQLKTTDAFFGTGGPGSNDTVLATSLIAGPGTYGVTPLPQNCAILIHKRTARPGRRGRGRMFLPGASEGETNHLGVINADNVTAYNTAMAGFKTQAIAHLEIVSLVLLHSDAPTSPTPAPDDITVLQADNVIATQRRRMR